MVNCFRSKNILVIAACLTLFLQGCSNNEKQSSSQPTEIIKHELATQNKANGNDVIILHQAIDGEAIVNPRSCSIIPTIDINLLQYPDKNSKTVGMLKSDKCGDIVGFELHTYPGKYPFEKDGQKGYLLSYRGEGYYTVLVDNKIKFMQFLDNKQKCKADFWMCIRDQNGFEGWVLYENKEDWKRSKYHGIFFRKGYVKGTDVNMRSDAGLSSSVIGTFKQHENITIIDSKMVNKKWWNYVARENGEKGWIAGDFMKYFN